jgi:hypothetical protein
MTAPTNPNLPGHAPDHDEDALHNADVAHEHSDINIRAIVVFLGVITLVTAIAALAMGGLFRVLDRMAARNDPPTSPVAAPAGQVPPEPRLLINEPMALQKQRSQERKVLENYGWVDKNAGVVHVPIDEAKKLLLHHGIAARAGEPVDPRLGTRAHAMSDASSGRHAVVRQKPAPAAPPQVPAAQPPPAGAKHRQDAHQEKQAVR